MVTVSLKEARQRLGQLVDAASRGEDIVITRRGRRAARLRPVEERPLPPLPDLDEFRASLGAGGGSLTESLLQLRDEERG